MEFLLGYKDDDNENDGNEESKREFTEDNEENTRKRKLKSTETPSKKIKLECSERASSSLKIKKNAQNPEEEENSNQSLGRIRIVPHIVGNYATFIYLPVKFNQYQNCHSKEIFKNTFSLIQKKLTTYLTRNSLNFTEDNLLHFTEEDDQYYKLSDINNITNTVNDATLTKDEKKSGEIGLHLSISSLIMLKKDQISRVVNGLRRALVIRKPIVVEFRNFEFFNNETKKRFFISLPVFNSTANEEINSLILGSNDVLKSFHLPTYNMVCYFSLDLFNLSAIN